MSSSARSRIIGLPATDAWHAEGFAPPTRRATSQAEDDALTHARELELARAEAFERGRAEGERAEAARLRQALALATEALEAVRESEERWVGAIEENIAALAVAVARHIVDRELGTEAEVTRTMVRRALDTFPIDQPVRIRVNPQDLAVISAFPETGSTGMAGAIVREAHWMGDARVMPGGCVVEGRERIVDGRVDTALERVYRRLAYKDT
jgi:flagellar biosynthesis/type III secretory pathway protein FliH